MKFFLTLCILLCISSTHYAQNVSLNGTAAELGESCYRVTQAQNTQNGSVWFEDQLDLSQDFDIHLVMNFGGNDGGADGMTFVMQNNGLDALGVGGEGVGYLNIPNSVGIEFDTWENGNVGDLFSDHIGIHSNGANNHNLAGPIQADIADINIEDGDDHEVRIKWTAASSLLEVFFDCEFRTSTSTDIVASSFGGDPLVYWGVVGSTGGANNLQTFCLNSGAGAPITYATCTGSSVLLDIGDVDPDEPVVWTPSDFLDDATSAAPLCTPPGPTSYEVSYTHVCGYEVTSNVNVEIEELELSPVTTPTIGCGGGSVLVTAASNYDDVEIEWSTVNGNITVVNGFNIVVDEVGQYTVSGNINGACNTDYVFDILPDTDGIFVEIDEPIVLDCYNSDQVLNATVGTNGVDIDWTTLDGNLVSGANGLTPVIDEAGTYTLNVGLDPTCVGEASVTVIESNEVLELSIGTVQTINCNNSSIIVDGVSNFNVVDYVWSPTPVSVIETGNVTSATIDEPGNYQIVATAGTCIDELNFTVDSNFETIDVDFVDISMINCTNETAEVDASATGSFNSTWTTNDGDILSTPGLLDLEAGEAGTYTLTVTNIASGCESEFSVDITEDFTLDFDVQEQVFLTCEEPQNQISVDVNGNPNNYLFSWTYFGETIELQGLNTFDVDTQGLVELEVTQNDCSGVADIEVLQAANYSIDLSSLVAPNVFSPNNDELNKTFKPFLFIDPEFDVIPFLENYSLTIYNRWGGIIYESGSSGWDGKINGTDADTGTYFYIITFDSVCGDLAEGELSGSVVILK